MVQVSVRVNGLPARCSAANQNCAYEATESYTPVIAGMPFLVSDNIDVITLMAKI